MTIVITEDQDLCTSGKEFGNMLQIGFRLADQNVMTVEGVSQGKGILQTLEDQILQGLCIGIQWRQVTQSTQTIIRTAQLLLGPRTNGMIFEFEDHSINLVDIPKVLPDCNLVDLCRG